MGQTDQRTELLRILLADDDDVRAFTMQVAINRLSRASAFLRVDNRELLAQKIRAFEPEMLVLAGPFAAPGELRQIKTLTNGSPIICLVPTPSDAEASLTAGATDCVLLSQQNGIGECLEKHLSGAAGEPHFRAIPGHPPKGPLSAAEQKLEQLDQRIAAYLRDLAKTTKIQWNRLKVGAQRASTVGRAWLEKQYRFVKIKYLLRKQERLVHKSNPPLPERRTETRKPLEASIPNRDATILPEQPATPYNRISPPEENSEALRAMELSFKTLFHSALDAMFLADGVGSVLHLNPAACGLLGITPPEILGKSLFNFVPSSDKVRATAMWEALLIEGQQKTDLVLQTASGEQREVSLAARANLWFGVHLLVFRDQTELRKLQQEVAASRELTRFNHQTSTGPLGTGMASRCAEAGSMKDENNGAGR